MNTLKRRGTVSRYRFGGRLNVEVERIGGPDSRAPVGTDRRRIGHGIGTVIPPHMTDSVEKGLVIFGEQ
jgi:hypothetical protein